MLQGFRSRACAKAFRDVEGAVESNHIFGQNNPNGQQVDDPEPGIESPSRPARQDTDEAAHHEHKIRKMNDGDDIGERIHFNISPVDQYYGRTRSKGRSRSLEVRPKDLLAWLLTRDRLV